MSLAWSFTWYGIPDIYNGAEMGLNGICYRDAEEKKQKKAEMIAGGILGCSSSLFFDCVVIGGYALAVSLSC